LYFMNAHKRRQRGFREFPFQQQDANRIGRSDNRSF
jgi:hypothetical protein